MKGTIEIRWHGRAGQGVVTAAVTLADVLSSEEGKYVQAFPFQFKIPSQMSTSHPTTAYESNSDL